MQRHAETLVIGAGPAGLAVAACLKQRALPVTLVDRAPSVGSSWRRHYDRLHLHTDHRHSALPHMPFPAGTPRYPSRAQVVAYLEHYARRFELVPHLGEDVRTIRVAHGGWITTTSSGVYESRRVVVATGYNALPHLPRWPGQERFSGPILHSSEYRNGESFRGQSVLVVGFGNSGGEIAIDLHESGARVALAVRGAVNVIPRDILGIPILSVGIALSRLPARVTDAVAAPLSRLSLGDITKLGFRRSSIGPVTQIKTQGRIPLIDVGTIRLIREGHIEVLGGVREMSEAAVTFEDGIARRFDALILATGFRPGTARFFEPHSTAPHGPRTGSPTATEDESGLYFCGFCVSPTGMLREIGREAQRIAADIARRTAGRI